MARVLSVEKSSTTTTWRGESVLVWIDASAVATYALAFLHGMRIEIINDENTTPPTV